VPASLGVPALRRSGPSRSAPGRARTGTGPSEGAIGRSRRRPAAPDDGPAGVR